MKILMLLATLAVSIHAHAGDPIQGVPFQLNDTTMRVDLQPHTLRSKDFSIMVQGTGGEIAERVSDCRILRGRVAAHPELLVVGRLVDGNLALFVLDLHVGSLWSVAKAGGEAVLDEGFGQLQCGNDFFAFPDHPEHPLAGGSSLLGNNCTRIAQIAIDCDYAFLHTDHGGDIDSVVSDVEACMALVEAIYAMHVGVTYEITSIIVRADQASDPYAPYERLGDMLDTMFGEWNGDGSMAGIETDIVHMISGQPAVDGYAGLAYVGAVCQSYRFGASRCACAGVVAHELGHNWGAGHCADTDTCNAMCGACLSIGPNDVTTMLAHRNSRTCLDVGSAWDEDIAPDARPDTVVIDDEPLTIDVLANDNDFSCGALEISDFDSVSARGSTIALIGTGSDAELRYSPAAGVLGFDTFDYEVINDNGLTDSTTVHVTVRTLNDIRVGLHCSGVFDTASIQEAIEAFAGGEDQRIVVTPGIYNENVVIDRPVTIEAEATARETIINAGGLGPVLQFSGSITETIELRGLTFSNGSAERGAAFLVTDQTVLLHDCRFVGNASNTTGGAIALDGGIASINDCAFWTNTAIESGTAIHNNGGLCLFYGSDATGNGTGGEAIRANAGTTRLLRSVLCSNTGGNIAGSWSDLGDNAIDDDCACTVDSFNILEDCNSNGAHDRCEVNTGSLSDENNNGIADSCDTGPATLMQWSIACGGNGHYYELVMPAGGITASAARSAASAQGGQLATLGTEEENTWVYNAVGSNPAGWFSYSDYYHQGPWIGLRRLNNEWVWLDGTPLEWTNWHPGEPSGNGIYGHLFNQGWDQLAASTWDDIGNESAESLLVEFVNPQDCNDNGSPDARDIALGTSLDENDDGIPDECAETCIADLNNDGVVDGADLANLLGFWGLSGEADLNKDGTVNGADLAILLGSWGCQA